MLSTAALLLASVVGADHPANVVYQYEGEVVAVKGDAAASRKTFVYRAITTTDAAGDSQFWWWLEQKGHGDWAWPDQFGQFTVGEGGAIRDGRLPHLVYDHDQGYTRIPLTPPVLLTEKPLKQDAQWEQDRLSYRVSSVGEDMAEVTVSSLRGQRARLAVDPQLRLIEDVRETVFIGPGQEHRLTMKLSQTETSAEALAAARASLAALADVREQLEVEPLTRQPNWTEQRLELMKAGLPDVVESAAGSPVEPLVLQAAGAAKLQKAVAKAVAQLADRTVGQPLPEFSLDRASLGGEDVTHDDLAGKVTVLHFWSYNDQPLVEPYGQIGYVDFLYRKHKAAGVQVFGVSIDDRLAFRDKRADALRSIRRLSSFMNLGYPVLLDQAGLLEQIGDPRTVGGELPLCLVIDREGKISHFHAGLYELDRDRGLKLLDEAIEAAKAKK